MNSIVSSSSLVFVHIDLAIAVWARHKVQEVAPVENGPADE
jgi:hypothetical protein